MQCYTQIVPPTAVSHAVSLPFLGPDADNLVVAKTSLLQIFELRQSAHPAASTSSNGDSLSASKLSLVAEYTLAGTITALRPVNLQSTRTGGQALLIAVKDAKLSLVEWDPENYRIGTISIHFYEGDSVLRQPFGPSLSECESFLTVDPSSRCAALKFGTNRLAILPFRQQGDELVDADDEPGDGRELKRTATNAEINGEASLTPYKSSFVMPVTEMHRHAAELVHFAFLHEYRSAPTVGLLSAAQAPSNAMLAARKDALTYGIYTVDLDQQTANTLLDVPKLPSDLWKVVPLALPVGGALLVGTNELIHVDQSGKTNAVAVNEFAKKASSFSMADQSGLGMKLEGCEIEVLDPASGDMLMVLNDGSLAVLTFQLLGRNVGGLGITRIASYDLEASTPSCVTSINGNRMFIGSEDGDSMLVRWRKDAEALSRKRSHAQMLGQDSEGVDGGDEDVDEDDLYAPTGDTERPAAAPTVTGPSTSDAAATYHVTLEDRLPALGPIHATSFGRPDKANSNKLELVSGVGMGQAGRLVFMNREVLPSQIRTRADLNTKNAWSIHTHAKNSKSFEPTDNLLFVCEGERTAVYSQASSPHAELEERSGTDFESEGETLAMYTLADSSCIVQCRRSEIRTYEADLGLSQIIPMIDEVTDAELRIVATSVCDPYMFVLRDDSSVQVLKVDKQGEVEPLEIEGPVKESKWLAGCLYSGPMTTHETTLWLLDEGAGLQIFSLPDLEQVYTASTMPFLPPILSPNAPLRRGAKATLTEILVASLGTEDVNREYLVLRTAMDDLVLYEPFFFEPSTAVSAQQHFDTLRLRKVPSQYVPSFDDSGEAEAAEDGRSPALRAVRVGGRYMLYVPSSRPHLVIKEPSSLPKVMRVRVSGVRGFTTVNTASCPNGFALVDRQGQLREFQMHPNASYETGWSVQQLALGEPRQEIRHVAFHPARGVYIVGTCRNVDFYPSEDDDRHQEHDDSMLRPQIPQYRVHLLSAATREIIQTIDMPYLETITSLKVMSLEVSEHTHEQRDMVVAGTTFMRGEDSPAKGAVTVFDIIDVVPDPDKAESGIKLQVVAREETKGAITALNGFQGGLIGTAQGQKIMIRGLKEDGSCLPVAFLDAQAYTTELKTFGHSDLWLAGDACKGVWLGGFTEEPYKLQVFNRTAAKDEMEVLAADFLPSPDGALYICVLDRDMNLRVLQYDPENPRADSLGGVTMRLLHKGRFHIGSLATGMAVVPSGLLPADAQMTNGHAESEPQRLFQVLATFADGSMGLITPLDEATFRRLSALQSQLASVLEHAGGLNPRAYRAAESEGLGGRGFVDGSLVQRIGELGTTRRAELLGRAGMDVWSLGSDLEIVGGGGLSYL